MNNNLSFIQPQDAWDRLSMKEKAEMMKVAVKNGITKLQDIRDRYNEFAEGGSTDTDWSYNSWKRQIAEHMGIRSDEDNTYDYEAYFNKYPEEAWKMLKGDPTAHFTDEFKTVYHPTFSSKSIGNDGSVYSGVRNPKTNPQGLVGGTWSPDYHTFTMSPDGYRGPVSMDDRKWYLENAEDNGVVLREADGSLPIYDGMPWGGVLPNVTVYGNKHAEGGNLFGGGGGVSGLMPALPFATIDWKKAAEKARNLYEYGKSYIKHKLEGDGEGEVIDLSKKKVSRIKSGTDNVTSILTNDFVEHNNNMVRKKKDFVNTTDTLLGDREIPLSKISTFYGIENGKLKAGPLSIFNDTTTVVPNRAKNIGKIKEYYPGKPGSKEALAKRREAINKEIAEYNNSKGYEPDWISKMLPFIPGAQPREVLHHNLVKEEGNNRVGRLRARKRYDDILRSMGDKYSYLVDSEPTRVITENNDTIIGYDLNASPKTLFADENGNAVFVAQPRQHAEELNSYLQEHPMYPIMVDNGRYAAYQTHFPNAEVYGGLNRPDDMYILGTTKALGGNLFRGGGYKPSASVKKRISTWEGAAMTGAKDPLSGKWGKNRSFEAEASSFYAALPTSIRKQVLSNPKLADNLFSYSYNVGAGNFKKRVVPALERYYSGMGSAEEIASSMWASGDKKLRGLRSRRAVERKGVVDALTPAFVQEPADNTFVYNPFAIQASNTQMMPMIVPDEGSFVTTHEVSPSEQRAESIKNRFDAINRFNVLMDLISPQNNPVPEFMPTTGNSFLDALGLFANSNARGGWKHGFGGNLFDGTSQPSQKMSIGLNVPKIGLDVQGWPDYTTQQIIAYGDENERRRKAIQDAYLNFVTESNDATAVANERPQNQHLVDKAIQGAKAHAAWEKEHSNLTAWGNVLGAVPFAIAAAPMLEAAASSTAGQGITTGLNYIANAAKAAPYVSKVLPWAEVALATGSATHGIQEMQEGVFTPMTALEISPLVPTTVGIGNNLYLPHLREHIYASKTPIGYDGMLPAAKRIAEGVLSGKRADIENPFWFNNESAETLAKEFAFVPKNISEAEKTQYLHDFGQRALRARADIWRMYNRLPQKYNTFVESEKYPGAYTAPEDIKALKWVPFPDKNVDPGDFVNSVGGNVGLPEITNLGKGIPDAGYTSKEFGATTLSDLWDLHPFSRPNDRLISRIQRGYKKAFNTTEAPEFKQLKPLDERLAKFEVGKLINAKPIMVKNDVPWTMDRKLITDANGNLNFRTSYTQGFHSDNIIPQSVIDWKAGKPIIGGSDIQLNPDSYNFLRVKLTTKSRRKK